MGKAARLAAVCTAVWALAATVGPLAAADLPANLPKATQQMLAAKHLDPALLNGLDEELKMPPAWVEGAKKEKVLTIAGTWDPAQFNAFARPFRERYPYIALHYVRGSRFDRVTKPLLAFKEGRQTFDIITGIGGEYSLLKDAGALENLSAIPNRKNVPANMQQPDGWWVGQRLRYWCMSYNTDRVTKDALPKTWDDVIGNPALSNGNLGIGDRPNLWLLPMWEDKGEAWVKSFAERLFAVNKPQFRKEGMNGLIELAIAGEFNVSLPSAEYRTQQLRDKGAPLSWHCPTPVPLTISEIVAMKGGHKNAAFMFIDWFLSKEGQIAQYAADYAPPIHKDLQRREFLAFPDEILNRPVALLDPSILEADLDKLLKIWEPLWYGGQEVKVREVKAALASVDKNGHAIVFDVDGAPHKTPIKGSSTHILIGGAEAEPSKLAAGQTCTITYPENGDAAIRVDCQ